MFSLYKACLEAVALTAIVLPGLSHKAEPPPKVEVLILNVERNDRNASTVHWEITNHRDRAILFPRGIASLGIYTVEIELHDKTGWTTLPKDREWTHVDSDPVKLERDRTYDYKFNLADNYMLPMWVTFPKARYAVPLNTELRLSITYFEDSDEWEAYLSELGAGKVNWGRMEPLLRKWGHQAFSAPFRLPTATSPTQK